MNSKLELTLKHLPKNPGIYQFLNDSGKIIYIGKAVNLKNRVGSYFKKNADLNFAKKKMVKEIVSIDYIVTNTENDSLVLEHTLVKKHQPKYNVMLKDDKNYLYIKVTNEPIERILTTRQKLGWGEYFGPYMSGGHVKNILKMIKKSFGYRSCSLIFKKNSQGTLEISWKSNIKIPCIDYYIKRCAGPCLLENDKVENYQKAIESAKNIFKGNFQNTLLELEKKMKEKAKLLQFEEAQEIKNDILSLKSLDESQSVRDYVEGNYDIINYIKKYNKFFIGVIEIRQSKITGYQNVEVEAKLEESDEEILSIFLESLEANHIESNEKIRYILPIELQSFESEKSQLSHKLEVPKIGGKLDMLKLCYKNIYEYAHRKYLASLSTKSFTKHTQEKLLESLGYEVKNKDIVFECNDISHLSGAHTVASRSVIENGKTNPWKYRKFNIKTLENGKIDDFFSLQEIIERRLKELLLKKNLPDLLIIDGGKWQLGSVMEVIERYIFQEKDNIENFNILENLQVCSLAKQEEEIFLPHESQSIKLDKNSEELRLMQKIRDEAHRFAITFNKEKRLKAQIKNILDSIPGIGPKTRKKLLKNFESVDNLKNISKQELGKYINKSQMESLEIHGII